MSAKYDENNVFAQILHKKIPADVVYEDDDVLSFHTIEPFADVHVLVIPKQQYIDYSDFVKNESNKKLIDFFKTIDLIAQRLNVGNSYKLITNQGFDSGQRVFHFHMHLLSGNIKKIIP